MLSVPLLPRPESLRCVVGGEPLVQGRAHLLGQVGDGEQLGEQLVDVEVPLGRGADEGAVSQRTHHRCRLLQPHGGGPEGRGDIAT